MKQKSFNNMSSRKNFISMASTAIGSFFFAPDLMIVSANKLFVQDRKTSLPEPTTKKTFQVHKWQRDPRNPVLPPGGGWFDEKCCMNPFALRIGDEYYLYYAGADKDGRRRICLATAPVSDLSKWTRHGPLFEPGKKGAFDEIWCVLPCVHKIGKKWHLYYTGHSADEGVGLQAFRGIGLAISSDLKTWTRYSEKPVMLGDGFPEWPDNIGIAGGGCILDIPQKNGEILYRMHYTLLTGVPSKTLQVNQAKQSVIAHSYDGITWFDKRVVLRPRQEAAYENAATTGLDVWKTKKGWRAIYPPIGTQFGAYSICEASSKDGLVWDRGEPEENLALAPIGDGWESKMVEYPAVIREQNKLRMFYCGNGYGSTGIGTAIAKPL